jgi:hypothetical protein
MTGSKDPVERAFELLVLAPIGAGLYALDMGPSVIETLVARGRAEVDRRQQDVTRRITTARSLGQVALAFGVPVLRQKVAARVDGARRRAEDLLGASPPAASPAPAPPPAPARPAVPVPAPPAAARPAGATFGTTPGATFGTTPGATFGATLGTTPGTTPGGTEDGTPAAGAPRRDELPIPGYDALSASQVVERLAGLGRAELDAVHAYEAAHRQRRTILGKIEQLAG